MPLCSGIRSGLTSGLLSGLNAGCGPKLLADIDMSAPVVAYDFSSVYATDEWLLQETSGTYANSVGSETLSNSGGLQGQSAMGLWDGSSYTARKAWEANTIIDQALCSSASVGEVNGEDFSFRLPLRSGAFAAQGALLSKYNGTSGWLLYTIAGEFSFSVKDTVGVLRELKTTGSQPGGYSNKAPGYISGWYDSSAEILYLKGDRFSEVSLDVSATNGNFSSAAKVALNSSDGSIDGHAEYQPLSLSLCVGANAQAMYDEDFWQHAGDPSALLDPPDRGSPLSIQVAAAAMAHFADDTLPIGYDDALSGSGLGLYCSNPRTNLMPYSEALDNAAWTKTTLTTLADFADAPDGFRASEKLTQTATAGRTFDGASVVAEADYTLSFWAHTDDGGHDFLLRATDQPGTGTIGSATESGTDSLQLFELPYTTDVAQTSSLQVIYPGLAADSDKVLYVHGVQVSSGGSSGDYVRTSGAAASTVQSNYRATGDYVSEGAGEIEAVFVIKAQPPSGELHYVFDTNAAADRRALYVDSTGDLKFLVNNSAGAAVATIALGTIAIDTEYTARCQWDESAGLDTSSVRGKLNALAKVSGGAAFASGAEFTAELSVGASDVTADTALDGLIKHVRSYNGPLEMAA